MLKQIASMDEAARLSSEDGGGASLSRKSSLARKDPSSQRNSVDVASTTGALNASSPPPLPPR